LTAQTHITRSDGVLDLNSKCIFARTTYLYLDDHKPVRGKFVFDQKVLERARIDHMLSLTPEEAAAELLRRKRGSRRGKWQREIIQWREAMASAHKLVQYMMEVEEKRRVAGNERPNE
jgi:hypothetical protein